MAARPSRAAAKLRNAPEIKGDTPDIGAPLPADCPVKPLGMADSKTPTAVYLSGSGILMELSGQAHGQGNLEGLFAPLNRYLWDHWPRHGKDGDITGFRAELARADLFKAAAERGIFNELESVRGAGAWRGRNGELVLHLGDRLLIDGDERGWGEFDGLVYPASARLLGPDPAPQPPGTDGPAQVLLSMLETWHWKHGAIAPRLVLGWICAGMLGGALKWRPALWPTGDRGTGKSTLIETIKELFGPNGAVATANTTAAGIRQALMSKTLPVLLDELEAQDDGGDGVHKVLELLRQASSGSIGLRGGADHKGQAFMIRSPMLATSINVPPLRNQDRSRIAVLELLALREGARAPAWTEARLHALGRQLLRRMQDGWGQLEDRLATWRSELGTHAGLDARGQDQYGTLLACADLALHDAPPDHETLAEVSAAVGGLLGDLKADDVADWRRCLDHMLTAPADAWRGGDRMTLGALLAQAAGEGAAEASTDSAQKALASYGLRLVDEFDEAQRIKVRCLAVANQHNGLARVFDRTIWAGRSGTSGGWRQTLLRAPGAWPRLASLRFEGLQSRVVLVPYRTALNQAEDVGA